MREFRASSFLKLSLPRSGQNRKLKQPLSAKQRDELRSENIHRLKRVEILG